LYWYLSIARASVISRMGTETTSIGQSFGVTAIDIRLRGFVVFEFGANFSTFCADTVSPAV